MELPDLYTYTDYRLFLKDLYLRWKEKRTRFSYLIYSVELGLPKSNYINQVIVGRRNLSLQAIEKICEKLKFRTQQKEFFRTLVLLNQATNEKKRAEYQAQLDKILGKRVKKLHPDEYTFFDNWFILAIRELIAFKNFVPNYNWIARSLVPNISEALVRKGMDVLERLQMIRKEGKRWVQTDAHLTTDPETQSHLVKHYHSEMIRLAHRALDLTTDERDMSGMTLGLSKDQFKELKQRIADFRATIQNDLEDSKSNPDLVAQLNIQLFPIAQPKKK